VYVCACARARVYVCMYVCMCVCVCVYIYIYIYIYINRNSQVTISTQIILKLDKVYQKYNFLFVSYCLFYRSAGTCSFLNFNLFYTKIVVTDDTLITFVYEANDSSEVYVRRQGLRNNWHIKM